MKVIKSNMYNVVNTEPFDIPMPLEFELLSGNSLISAYTINGDGRVDYKFNPASKEKHLTSTNRPLDLNDIYFLFSSRVFPDKMPFTRNELDRFGVEEYNPYDIVRKTHGIMPADRYWLRFSDEELTYKKVMNDFNSFFANPAPPSSIYGEMGQNAENEGKSQTIYSLDSILNQKSNEYTSIHDVNSILTQNALDVQELAARADGVLVTESAFAPAAHKSVDNDILSHGEIASLLNKMASETVEEPETSGGNMSPEAIAALLAGNTADEPAAPVKSEPDTSGGNMSPEAIAALLAGNTADEPVAPVKSEPETSGGNMSPEAIAALLAGNTVDEPAAPVKSEPDTSGGNMSPEAIAALLAGNTADEPAAPVKSEPETSSGNMSPEAIAALLAGNTADEPAAPVKSEPETSGGNMSPEAIAALLAESDTAEKAGGADGQ